MYAFAGLVDADAQVLKAGKHGVMCAANEDCGCPVAVAAGGSCLIKCTSVMVPPPSGQGAKVSGKRCTFSLGSLVTGDPCTYDEECASQRCLAGTRRCSTGWKEWGALCQTSDQCAGDGSCQNNGTVRVCLGYDRSVGQRCFPGDSCTPATSTTCLPSTTSSGGTCVARAAANQQCTRLNPSFASENYQPCQDGLQCRAPNPQFQATSTGVCVPLATKGQTCTLAASEMGDDHTTPITLCADTEAAHGLQCVVTGAGNVTGVCRSYLEQGQACQMQPEGPSPATCDPNVLPSLHCTAGVCSPPTGPGQGKACDFTKDVPCARKASALDPELKCIMYQAPGEQTFSPRCTANSKLADGTMLSCPSSTTSGRACVTSGDPSGGNAALLCTSGVAVVTVGSTGGGGSRDTVYQCLSNAGAFGSTGASCPAQQVDDPFNRYTPPLGYECVCTLRDVSAGMLLPTRLLKAPTDSSSTTSSPLQCFPKGQDQPSVLCVVRLAGTQTACGFLVSSSDDQLKAAQPVRMTSGAVSAINAPACMAYSLQQAVFVTEGAQGAKAQCVASLSSACGARHDFGTIECNNSGGGSSFPTWAIVVIAVGALLLLTLAVVLFGRSQLGWCKSDPGYEPFAPSGLGEGAGPEGRGPPRGGGNGRGSRGGRREDGRLHHGRDPEAAEAGSYVPPVPHTTAAHTQELPPSGGDRGTHGDDDAHYGEPVAPLTGVGARGPQTSFSSLAEDDADVEDLGKP